ncbi:phosphoribosylformylglycinamidine synthase [Psychrobacter jeotgali]|uniref:phosphoribosylformylglycinamidine synthase n=1 Tax=Psychrobacter jeotgali TaxID=179010 RepID=UPI0019192526|nr:phosphoribosylformylglycinamidine synthase [Psychrobacter jeotgali]
MMTIAGQPFLTDFQTQQLINQFAQKTELNVTQISTQQVYVLSRELVGDEHKKALDLFGIDNNIELVTPKDDQIQMIVSPRFGTISPWASKATDIFNNCEIQIHRVERVIVYTLTIEGAVQETLPTAAERLLFDRMTQSLVYDLAKVSKLFDDEPPAGLNHIDVMGAGREALESANIEFGFALSSEDIDYLINAYVNDLQRNPTDVELMMFAQANSEHCRHKIFNAQWTVDGKVQPKSLFQMIKNTYQANPQGILSAYKDNAAVRTGSEGQRYYPIPVANGEDPQDANSAHIYDFHQQAIDILMKVETHNHPTAIAPYAGAATGAGGEIRDEGATGRGGKPKAGLTGFHVSHLHIPEMPEKWEQSGQVSTQDYGTPERMATSLEIMTEAPLGSANFSNEFGRPNLCGYFRSFQLDTSAAKDGSEMRGYHKPIMLAGGYGNIKRNLIEKNPIREGDLLIVLGGPAMQIGLGGGAASSVDSGSLDEGLDFASVQRDNAEMERRCQEVIDRCWALAGNDIEVSNNSKDGNPIVSIHDVGAGGLSNAMPELVDDHDMGAHLNLRKIPSLEAGMSPMAIWSNEAQERYVLAIRPESKDQFDAICARERCPYAILGSATEVRQLVVDDDLLDAQPVDMPMQVLLGGTPQMQRSFERQANELAPLVLNDFDLTESVKDVLRHPTVASKSFLISIGDRSITGMVVRDQYVGRYQVPVADCAITASGLLNLDGQPMTGEAMSIGERTPVALIDPKASARLAVGEAITNIAGARIAQLSDITMSANWMAACGNDMEDAALFDAVHAIGEELCPALGIAIPVGKDSLSMRANWTDDNAEQDNQDKSVVSPMSLVITAFAPVVNVAKTLTPELINGDSAFYRIDLSKGKLRLGGSILAQTASQLGNQCPDLDKPSDLVDFFNFIQAGNEQGVVAAYHDIGDGGLLATIAEMQFTSRQGIKLSLADDNLLGQLFSEELGAVIQVLPENVAKLIELADEYNVSDMLSLVGQSTEEDSLIIQTPLHQGEDTLRFSRSELQQEWSQVSYQIARRRDNPACVQQEYDLISDSTHKGLIAAPNFDLNQKVEAPYLNSRDTKPKVAILREQGVNGQTEMAAGFTQAGFEALDVHMSDLLEGRIDLRDFEGLVACGGFSYGDVLGAGSGWANSILFHDELRMQFVRFFARPNTFSLGVCNGCQMMAQLKDLIPGAENFPRFIANQSARFEARTVNVKVERTKSILFKGMQDSILPIAVAHGEGYATLNAIEIDGMEKHGQLAMRYVDSQGHPTETYPLNPNGSVGGVTGLCSTDGRVTIMMPHPERNLRAYNHSWKPEQWDEDGAWMRMFRNARAWLR